VTNIFYNDGTGPDPYPSPGGTYPFTIADTVRHTYGDNGVFNVTLTVEDDDGGIASYATTITVDNVAPTVDVQAYVLANFTLRIAGEKWHNVEMFIYADDEEIGYAEVVRYPGNPDEQTASTGYIKCDITRTITAEIIYTPEDDPVNGQINGANPVWLALSFEDGSEVRLKHTFNVQHPETWEWNVNINPYLMGHEITFEATATDPGSDDLTFTWNWGDGTPENETTYYNDGTGPDPYPSPGGTYPFTATDMQKHTFRASGVYAVVLTVEDDDGGVATASLTIVIP
ncbi:MAG: PKD domain-containing protein, partial [Thermoplasmata archaeon]|nr:PKD domain-containing protein [Thermoplasmata archaeon]